jgi:transcriptional regulator
MNRRIIGAFTLAPKRNPADMADSTDVIQGTLDMLILKSLSLEPMHGFGVTKRIEQISRGVFRVNPGSLLLAFQRMERQGLISGDWRVSDNNRRAKYYRLTAKGRKHLDAETTDWNRRVAAIARLLEG